jgi:hypothetical protein
MSAPSFSDLGKSLNDLLTKKYSENALEISCKFDNALSAEANAKLNRKNEPDGSVKGTYVAAGVGKLEVDVSTSGKAKATAKFTKLADNLTVQVGASSAKLDKAYLADDKAEGSSWKGKNFFTFSADYATKALNASLAVNSDLNGAFVDTAATVAENGLSTSAWAKLAVAKKTAQGSDAATLQDCGLGVQYTSADYTAGMSCTQMWNQLTLNQIVDVSPSYQFGSKFVWNAQGDASLLSLGSSYKIDRDTLLKLKVSVGKAEDSKKAGDFKDSFKFTSYFEKAVSAQLKVGVTAEIDASKKTNLIPGNFGFSFNFGEKA